MPKVSVIVPVYNSERYLKKCLDSLCNQTLSDIEIICVDDGSNDGSIQILNDYSTKDSRIKVLHQEHKKQGAARNKGTLAASGEYIGFVDSDDWVDLEYYEKLYNAAKKFDLDIALATNVRIGKNKYKKRIEIKDEIVYKTVQEKFDVCCQWKNECPTNKIYRISLLKEKNIVWPEGVYCEDKIFTTKAVYYANGVVSVPDIKYYYFVNPTSTVKTTTKEHKEILKRDKNQARRDVLDFLKTQNADIRDGDFWATSGEFKFLGVLFMRIKESIRTKKYLLFGVIPIFFLRGA